MFYIFKVRQKPNAEEIQDSFPFSYFLRPFLVSWIDGYAFIIILIYNGENSLILFVLVFQCLENWFMLSLS